MVILKAGGPDYPVPLGRRDSLDYANESTVLSNIPAPTSNLSQLTVSFDNKGLNLTDLVALSGLMPVLSTPLTHMTK